MFARQGLLHRNTRLLSRTISAPHTRLNSILKMSTPSNRRPDPPLSDSIWEMFSMKGKVVSITGGGGGIGFEVARAMAEAGADVAIWYNSSKKAVDRASFLEKTYNVKAKAYQCQITDPEAVRGTISTIIKEFGKIDSMIVNHGIPSQASILDGSYDDWKKVIDTDLNGSFYVAKAVGEHFRERKSGNLIFTASMSGHIANYPQLQGCYNSAKAALIHLARSLALEWAPFNARVNSVSPGYIHTEISDFVAKDIQAKWYDFTIKMQRDGDPRELKGAYLYLASDASTYTTGTDILVDGGYCVR